MIRIKGRNQDQDDSAIVEKRLHGDAKLTDILGYLLFLVGS